MPNSNVVDRSQGKFRLLVVSKRPNDFAQLTEEAQTVVFSFCTPNEILEQVGQMAGSTTSDLPLLLAVDARELSWETARQLVTPVHAQLPLRLIPLVWLLNPDQQLEFEPAQTELNMFTNFFYPAQQPASLLEARLRYMVGFIAPMKEYVKMSRQLYSAVRQVEYSHDALIVIDLEFKITSWNPAAERIYGWTSQEAIGQSISMLQYSVPPDQEALDIMIDNPPHDNIWSEGKWAGTAVHRTRDGRRLIINSAVAAIRDVNKKIVEFVGINRDVTLQKQIEQELLQRSRDLETANTFLDRLVEQSPIGIGIYARDGLCLQLNQAACQGMGISDARSIIGHYNILNDAYSIQSGFTDTLKPVFKGEIVVLRNLEINLSKVDPKLGITQSRVVVNHLMFPVFDNQGQVQNIVILTEDVTEQRNLTNQLMQSQKMEMIGALAGGLAHDFNNVLTVLFLSVESLKERLQRARHTEALGELAEIETIGKHAADLTSRLLIFTRQKLDHPELIYINDVVSVTIHLLRRTVSEAIHLEFIAAPDLLPVRASPSQLQQVLMNLVVNARDALTEQKQLKAHRPEPQHSTISIKTFSRVFESHPKAGFQPTNSDWSRYIILPDKLQVEASTNTYVGCTIEDNGTGIPPEQMVLIFEPLYTTKEAGKGTGLGLAICYAVASDCGGWLELESRVGSGSRFTLYLPEARESGIGLPDAQPTAQLDSSLANQQAKPSIRQSRTVLLVEDEGSLRKVISRVLGLEGWQVLTAEDGQAALDFYQEHQSEIDLVITDTVMPRMGGIELVSKILEINPQARVILMSGYFDNKTELDNISTMLEANQLRFLAKPFKIETLLQMVKTVAI